MAQNAVALKHYQMYINGKFMDSKSGNEITVLNPSTGEKISTVPAATREEAKEAIDAALARIKAIVAKPEIGEIYEGKVKSIMPFGAFVEIMPGKDGLLHISEIDWKRLETMDGVFKEGDMVTVKLLDVDKQGKMKLSRKVLLPRPPREDKPKQENKPQGE